MAQIIAVNAYPNGFDQTSRFFEYLGQVTVGAGNYTLGTGLPMAWNPGAVSSTGAKVLIESRQAYPSFVLFTSLNGYQYVQMANGNLRINTASNTELTNGAIPAGVSSDVITFYAKFTK